MKNMLTRLKTLAILGIAAGLALGAQAALDPVRYMNWDDTQKSLVETTCTSYTLVTSADAEWSSAVNGGWYVVNGTVTISSTVTCKGAVHLILKDGAKLTVTGKNGCAGICVSGDGNSFAVYGQSGQSGELVATGAGMYGAGIGGSGGIKSVATGSNITIDGGKVTATGGISAAGIGGGLNGAGSNITINGGVVTATGGNCGAGIGGGSEGTGSDITINGGKVTAAGNGGGAGIGGGDQVAGSGSDITINGGNVTATGAAGGAGIGGGSFGSGSNITINGGTVTATGGVASSISGAGIGGGNKGVGSNITIDGGVVTATAGDADVAGIGNGKGASTTATGIKAAASLNVKVSTDNTNWSTITHTAESDIATDLAGKQYVKALPPVAYMAWKADAKQLVEATCDDYELVTSGDTGWGDVTTEKWYVVDGQIAINNTVTCTGAVHLIVKDGASLTVTGEAGKAGICVSGDGNSLAVYGQSGQSGELIATGGNYGAGIGGGNGAAGSNITINGGIVTALGDGAASGACAAGIGGGNGGDGSNITINGGTVTAVGNGGGAGIGGAAAAGSGITINGGTVIATGWMGGAGIGGGGYAAGSDITINGGCITAAGGGDGATGIGSGKSGSAASNIKVNPLLVLKADGNNPPTTVIANTGEDLATALKGQRYATTTASDYTLVLKDGEAYKNSVGTANKITQGAAAAGLTYTAATGETPATWTMSNFVFTTTTATALQFADSGTAGEPVNITIKVEGANNNITSGAQASGHTYGIKFSGSNANFTISGTGGKSVLNAVSGQASGSAAYSCGIGCGDKTTSANSPTLTFTGLTANFTGGQSSNGYSKGADSCGNITVGNDAAVTFMSTGTPSSTKASRGIHMQVSSALLKVEGTGKLVASCQNQGTKDTAVWVQSMPDARAVATGTETELTWDAGRKTYMNNDTIATDVTMTAKLPAKVTVTDVTGATSLAYTNGVPLTGAQPYTVNFGASVKVVYTAAENYMFPGGYRTFTTNVTANAATLTVALTDDQKPVAAKACEECLTFSAADDFGIKMWKVGNPPMVNLECSTNQIYWETFNKDDGAAAGPDHKLYLRGTGNKAFAGRVARYYAFTNTIDSVVTAIACSGNIETLLDYQTVAAGNHPEMAEYAFAYLFSNFSALTTAPTLPAEELSYACYIYMFCGCSSLTVAPTLPAEELAEGCYNSMFSDCSSLTTAPKLLAEKLAPKCYYNMFSDCSTLTNAPALPATNLVDSCYYSMFSGCASLTAAPELPAKSLAMSCYCGMFLNCASLTEAPELPAETLMNECYYGMFQGCTSLTAAPKLSATTLQESCYSSMFRDCTLLTAVPELPVTNLANNCYSSMFQGCTSLTAAPELPATNLAGSCYYGMFQGCTSLVVNTNAPGKAWSIPAEAAASAGTAQNWNLNMFKGTSGDITNTTVTCGVTYYVRIAPVTVVLPEVEGATAQLYTFYTQGGWTSVATNEVPSNATVRVVWTAAEGKGLTGAGAVNAFEWMAELKATSSVQTAPQPVVGEAGESVITLNVDTRSSKKYFDAAEILPVWYAAGAEVKVEGPGKSETIVKDAANINTLSWTPTEQGTYDLSQTGLNNAQITLTTPVKVTTNGLQVTGAAVEVTVNGAALPEDGIVASNSTVTATWTTTGSGVYFMDGRTTYTQTFTADKPVNPVSEAVTKPEEPKAPSLLLGMVAQRYPWDGKIDVQYWAKNTPNEGYKITVTVTLPDGATASETSDCRNGKNKVAFDARAKFGEVQFTSGVKVKATLSEPK